MIPITLRLLRILITLMVKSVSGGLSLWQLSLFAVQEGTALVLKPAGGRFGDRTGLLPAIGLGMLLLGVALPLVPAAHTIVGLLMTAVVIGAAQALIFPSTTALVAAQIQASNLCAGMGFLGTMQNGGKVLGPLLGGLMIRRLDFAPSFFLMGLLLAAAAVLVGLKGLQNLRKSAAHPRSI